jgi:hypothetical protein
LKESKQSIQKKTFLCLQKLLQRSHDLISLFASKDCNVIALLYKPKTFSDQCHKDVSIGQYCVPDKNGMALSSLTIVLNIRFRFTARKLKKKK